MQAGSPMKRVRPLIVLSAISLLMATTILAAWCYQTRQGNWVASRHYGFQFSTRDATFRFFVPAQTINVPGFPPRLTYRRVLSLPLWPTVSVGFVLPIICAFRLAAGKRSPKHGFGVIPTANRPPA
jgi:hypothetical protein